MQQCAHCQYFVPKGYLNCPQCSFPLTAGVVTTHSVYSGTSGGGTARKNSTAIVIGVGIALVAVVVMTMVARSGGDEKKFVDNDSLVAPTADGWRNFSPPDGLFTASFPGVPERTEEPLNDLNQVIVDYNIKQGDFSFGVAVFPAPSYIAPHEAGKKLDELLRPLYQVEGTVLEGASQLLTPRGDQAFDVVAVDQETRAWIRATTWRGSIIMAYAELPTGKQPTGAQSETYRRLRDSLRQ